MTEFTHPWVFWFALLVLAVFGIHFWRGPRVITLPADEIPWQPLSRARGNTRFRLPGRCLLPRLMDVAACLLLLSLLAILAQPRKRFTGLHEREATNIIIALDASGSMADPFGLAKETCFTVATQVIKDFVDGRQGDAAGLLVFGTQAVPLSPPTQDLAALGTMPSYWHPRDRAGDENEESSLTRTNIATALDVAHHEVTHGRGGDRMVILISDAKDESFTTPVAARIQKEWRKTGTELNVVLLQVNHVEGPLADLAGITGGGAYPAADPAALRRVFARIDLMRKARYKAAADQFQPANTPWIFLSLGCCAFLSLTTACGCRFTPW